MEITQLTQDSEMWKREKEVMKIKYIQNIPFLESWKFIETTFPSQPYLSNATFTKPRLPEVNSPNRKTFQSETGWIPNLLKGATGFHTPN